MGDRAGSEGRVVERKRVGVFGPAGARRRVARVAERDHRPFAELLDLCGGEYLRNQAHVALNAHRRPVGHRDARRFLAPVLKREEPEVSDVGHVDPVLGADAEDPAHT